MQLLYLLTFTLVVYEGFTNEEERRILGRFKIEGKLLIILLVSILWIFFTALFSIGIRIFFCNIKKLNTLLTKCLMWAMRVTWLIFTGLLIFGFVKIFTDDSCFMLVWCLSFIFWFLNLVYEGLQMAYLRGGEYFDSGKNVLEATNLFTNIFILLALVDPGDFQFKASLLGADKNNSLFFELVYTYASTCLLLRYITFLLCLEKMDKIGIYVVAFRKAFNKSLNLGPIILILFTGFTVTYKLNKIASDQEFVNATLLQSAAQISRMFLANIEDLSKMGITEDCSKSISNSVNFILFVIMIPILLINLLIGVSTGELTNILDASDLTQYQMRLRFILWLQSFLLKWQGEDWCRKKILFVK